MKEWAADHPRARVMARKRAAILDAARNVFLTAGYGNSTMEGIAAAAGVSIMTLYRHAESKEDLFSAVVHRACHPSEDAEQAAVEDGLKGSLRDVLVFVGIMFQKRIAGAETTALLRAVMVETRRFPHLAELAYQGLIGSHGDVLDDFLSGRVELSNMGDADRRRLGTRYLDGLVGIDCFRVLLGLPGLPEKAKRRRAEEATEALLSAL